MARTVLVNIDVEKLRANLAKADGHEVSADQALRFLTDAGFTRSERGWVVAEKDLGQLDPSEVLSAEPIEGDSPS